MLPDITPLTRTRFPPLRLYLRIKEQNECPPHRDGEGLNGVIPWCSINVYGTDGGWTPVQCSSPSAHTEAPVGQQDRLAEKQLP